MSRPNLGDTRGEQVPSTKMRGPTQLKPRIELRRVHKATVEGVSWHPLSPSHLASVGVDRRMVLWDTRMQVKNTPLYKDLPQAACVWIP